MPVRFTIRERANPRDTDAPKQFYPVARSSGSTNLKRISSRIASISTVNKADVLAVLDLLVQVMSEEVAEGRIIKLGEFGSFAVTLNTSGSPQAELVTTGNIKNANLRFRPGEDLSKMLLTLKYEKLQATPGHTLPEK